MSSVPDGPAPDTRITELTATLSAWRVVVLDAAADLGADRPEVQSQSSRLESPTAVFEFLDFFVDFFLRTAVDVGRLSDEIVSNATRQHAGMLRQLAQASVEAQRRSVMFRDKWINRPLPYEQVRPLLTRISSLSRDTLASYRELETAADALEQILGAPAPPPAPGERLDRRALFNRLLRRNEQ
ncbi:MAG: hypothetical protein AB7F99_01500 [Vicinamibacterales bacterium]